MEVSELAYDMILMAEFSLPNRRMYLATGKPTLQHDARIAKLRLPRDVS